MICSSPSTLLSSDISCGKTSHECLGCCNYSLYDKCSDDTSSNLQTVSDIGSILVLRCCKYMHADSINGQADNIYLIVSNSPSKTFPT